MHNTLTTRQTQVLIDDYDETGPVKTELILNDDEDIRRHVKQYRKNPELATAVYLEALATVVAFARPLTLVEMCELTGWNRKTALNRLSAGTFPIKHRKVGKRIVFDFQPVLEYMAGESQ